MTLISKVELIEKIEEARAESHKEAKNLDEHYKVNAYADMFIRLLNTCTEIESR